METRYQDSIAALKIHCAVVNIHKPVVSNHDGFMIIADALLMHD